MRASLETGGVPVQLKYKPHRPRRPEIYVLCDVSTSVTSASVFFLSVMHALHDSFRKMRGFLMHAKGLTEDEAISLMSIAVDFGITQVVDGNWGVHAIIKKNVFAGQA